MSKVVEISIEDNWSRAEQILFERDFEYFVDLYETKVKDSKSLEVDIVDIKSDTC